MSREITTILKHIPNVTDFNWAFTPNETKEAYFEKFLVKYYFNCIEVCLFLNTVIF